jgi:Mg2+ and Co2+ transporter CorA
MGVVMDTVAEKLNDINQTLERQNQIAQNMLDFMKKPENPILKGLTIAGIIAGILGAIQVIDTVLKWL